MKQVHTLVIEFDEGKAPTYAAGDQIHGGLLVAVDFSGDRLAVAAKLQEALEHALLWYGDEEPAPSWVFEAQAALAKANG
jgi:hypothetical protein